MPGRKPQTGARAPWPRPYAMPQRWIGDAGSGKISSSPLSIPSKMPAAADSGEAFGISKPRFISVSMGPRMTAWTEHWLYWTRHFGPLSGHDAKVDQPRERYVLTVFCYGCNLGPTQTARSVKDLDRFKLAFSEVVLSI